MKQTIIINSLNKETLAKLPYLYTPSETLYIDGELPSQVIDVKDEVYSGSLEVVRRIVVVREDLDKEKPF